MPSIIARVLMYGSRTLALLSRFVFSSSKSTVNDLGHDFSFCWYPQFWCMLHTQCLLTLHRTNYSDFLLRNSYNLLLQLKSNSSYIKTGRILIKKCSHSKTSFMLHCINDAFYPLMMMHFYLAFYLHPQPVCNRSHSWKIALYSKLSIPRIWK